MNECSAIIIIIISIHPMCSPIIPTYLPTYIGHQEDDDEGGDGFFDAPQQGVHHPDCQQQELVYGRKSDVIVRSSGVHTYLPTYLRWFIDLIEEGGKEARHVGNLQHIRAAYFKTMFRLVSIQTYERESISLSSSSSSAAAAVSISLSDLPTYLPRSISTPRTLVTSARGLFVSLSV